MSLSRWLPDYPDPMTYLEVFLSGSSVNNTEYANPEYDALIKKIKTELGNDEKARWKALQDAEKCCWMMRYCSSIPARIIVLTKAVCERFIRTSIWTSNKFKVGRCTKIKDEKTDHVCGSLF